MCPRSNRVDPWGDLHADPARGTLMGNRGCLHDDAGAIRRHHVGRRWIICRLSFKGRRRPLMQPGRYTELFFLDEATALAAGHRPCAECRRQDYGAFVAAFKQGNPALAAQISGADSLDRALHTARWQDGQHVTFTARLGALPPGVILLDPFSNAPLRVDAQGRLWRWHFSGYIPGPELRPTTNVTVLTPAPTVNAITAGYRVTWTDQ